MKSCLAKKGIIFDGDSFINQSRFDVYAAGNFHKMFIRQYAQGNGHKVMFSINHILTGSFS